MFGAVSLGAVLLGAVMPGGVILGGVMLGAVPLSTERPARARSLSTKEDTVLERGQCVRTTHLIRTTATAIPQSRNQNVHRNSGTHGVNTDEKTRDAVTPCAQQRGAVGAASRRSDTADTRS